MDLNAELPEVETVKRTLEGKLVGLTITGVQILMPKIIRTPTPEEFTLLITGQKVSRIGRRGKYLLFYLNSGFILVVHLRMPGQLIYCPPDREVAKHTHLIFTMDNGYQLRYVDIRQFGQLALVPAGEIHDYPGLAKLGPEPLEAEFTRELFKKELRNRRTKIKPLLLD